MIGASFNRSEGDAETEGENSEDSFSETVLRCYREGLHSERDTHRHAQTHAHTHTHPLTRMVAHSEH